MQGARSSGATARGRPPRVSGGRGGNQRGATDTAVRSETRAPARAYAIRAREEASSPDVITGHWDSYCCVLGTVVEVITPAEILWYYFFFVVEEHLACIGYYILSICGIVNFKPCENGLCGRRVGC
ncbi:uncharacterized protein LOC128296339 [Gossypium arboreum]|uniref:uncharacterized protein LOC128296339 n=1 Tax=Gossypium arboreum TaxID=29729 RepID=UPI0022F1C0EC|nr:uncharacterized protein LOC128296339 [Gossypium arboreum]